MPSVYLLRRNQQALLRTREALCTHALAPQDSWRCSGSSEQWRAALDALMRDPPDLLVCDLRLLDGPVRALLQRLPRPLPRVLLLTPMVDDPELFATLASGAHGYCLERDPAGLVKAVGGLLAQRACISPALSRQLLQAFGMPRSELHQAHCVAACHDHRPTDAGLSVAQQHLLSLFSHGLLDKEIAQRWQLGVEEIGRRVGELYAALHRRSEQLSPLQPSAA